MLENLFQAMLLTSCIGAALSLLLLLLKPATKKYFSSNWHYYIWLVVLFVMILPVRFHLPIAAPPAVFTPVQTAMLPAPQTDALTHLEPQETAQPTQTTPAPATLIWLKTVWGNKSVIFPLLWLAVAAGLLLLKLLRYAAFLRSVRKHSDIISCPALAAFTDRNILVRASDRISSPLMVGILKPTLLLPKTELTQQQFEHILAHETTHLKRNDICYKWFVSFVKCVHWFNPMIYLVQHQINLECEISCDAAVTKHMNETETRSYADTILTLLAAGRSKTIPLTTGMTGSKKNLKRRFIMMKNKKTVSKLTSFISVLLTVVLLSTTIFASGALSYLVADDYTIEITNNGEKIALGNKPFIENGEVYLPLREIFEKLNVTNDIKWDNGKIDITLSLPIDPYQNNKIIDTSKVEFFYEIKLGSDSIVVNPNSEDSYTSYAADMLNVPILKNDKTYITYDYMDYMLGGGAYSDKHHIAYTVYDKNGNLIDKSRNSFETGMIMVDENATVVYKSDDLKNPEHTVIGFFEAFSDSNFTLMKNYCTENCRNTFFGDGHCFGMTSATIQQVEIDPFEYTKSSNDFNIMVDVRMEPAELSVFAPDQTQTSFYVCLVRQPDDRYLIDRFVTGL